MYEACSFGDIEKVEAILGIDIQQENKENKQEFKDIDLKDEFEYTPLMYACRGNYSQISKLLLANGANVRASGLKGLCALHIAAQLSALQCMEVLLSSSEIDPDQRDESGNTPAHICCRNGDLSGLQLLHDRGASISGFTNSKTSMIMQAVLSLQLPIVEFVVQMSGEDINLSDKDGYTALHYASLLGNKGIVSYLIRHGAKVDVKTNEDKTPFDIALNKECKEKLQI